MIAVGVTVVYFNFIRVPSETVSVSKRKNYDVVTLALPNASDPMVFGPKYWLAYNFLDSNIPCPGCRSKAVPMGTFRHDIVNAMTDKPIHDKENWKKWVGIINDLDKKIPA